jgi:hypothetical protein
MTTWKVYSHPINPMVLLDASLPPPAGSTMEAETSNPNYLKEQIAANKKLTGA